MAKRNRTISIAIIFALLCCSCTRESNVSEKAIPTPATTKPVVVKSLATPFEHTLPLGLPEYHIADKDNPMTVEKVELGRKLFFDTALSADHTMSCATCHDPDKGWSNGLPLAEGVNGQSGKRNVPTIVNAAFNRAQFWDGRAYSLEGQALGPILNKDEMGLSLIHI